MPAEVQKFSLIVLGDALVNSHELAKSLAVGATLKDEKAEFGHPETVVKGHAYVNKKADGGKWSFRGGVTEGINITEMFDWVKFRWLARNIETNDFGDFAVTVFEKGGTYSMDDIVGQSGQSDSVQGDDKGRHLVVFNTDEDIQLIGTSDGSGFGPSVLAPMSTVTLDGSAGYVDGFIIANSFQNSTTFPEIVPHPDGLQMHGVGYAGPVSCK